MMGADALTNIENAVDRTAAAVIEEATAIARLRREIALIIEALEKLDLAKFQALENHPQGEAARARYREIVEQLEPATASCERDMPKKQSGIPKDVNQNAAGIVALTTGQDVPMNVSDADKRRRSEAASILGKLGGLKGGKAGAKSLSASRRKQIAGDAARKRLKAPTLSQKHKYRLVNGLYCIVNSSPENL